MINEVRRVLIAQGRVGQQYQPGCTNRNCNPVAWGKNPMRMPVILSAVSRHLDLYFGRLDTMLTIYPLCDVDSHI